MACGLQGEIMQKNHRDRGRSAFIRQNLRVSLGVVALLIPTTLFGWVGIGVAVRMRAKRAFAGNMVLLCRLVNLELELGVAASPFLPQLKLRS